MNTFGYLFIALLTAAGVSGCNATQEEQKNLSPAKPIDSPAPNRAHGQYLVTLSTADVAKLRETFAEYGPAEIQQIGDNLYLMHISDDPGPEAMEGIAGEAGFIEAIQPNYIYGINPPAGTLKRAQ